MNISSISNYIISSYQAVFPESKEKTITPTDVPGTKEKLTITYKDGMIFSGEVENGMKNGIGKLSLGNIVVYEGGFKNDQYHGKGILRCRDGCVYDCEFIKGVPNGKGILTNHGEVYDCFFLNGSPHGFGTLTTPDSVYKGEFKNGGPEGQGSLTKKDGTVYTGGFIKGAYEGHGNLKLSDGRIYDCEFKNGAPDGHGSLTNKNGDVYVGQFVKGSPTGHGKLTSPDGHTSEGEFKDGRLNGQGIEIFKGGFCKGEFRNGQLHGQGIFSLEEGPTFEGEFTNGIPLALEKYYDALGKELNGLRNSKDRVLKLSALKDSMRVALCQKAIAAQKKSFEENYRTILEKSIDSERRAKILQDLIDEEEKAKAAAQKKENKQKNKTPPQVKHPEPAPISQSSTAPAVKTIKDPIKSFQAKKHICLKRVTRWETKDFGEIKGFTDFRGGRPVLQYAGLTDQEIRRQRMRHYLPNIECLLGEGNKGVYYTETERGYRMLAVLVRSENEDDIEYGDVFLGIEKNTIFHKMFEPWPGTQKDFERLGREPELPEKRKGSEDNNWEPVDKTHKCAWTMDSKGVIEFSFTGETHKLRVLPLKAI